MPPSWSFVGASDLPSSSVKVTAAVPVTVLQAGAVHSVPPSWPPVPVVLVPLELEVLPWPELPSPVSSDGGELHAASGRERRSRAGAERSLIPSPYTMDRDPSIPGTAGCSWAGRVLRRRYAGQD